MCINSYLSLNQVQASAINPLATDENNAKKPVEALTNTEPKAASHDTNNTSFIEQDAESVFSTVDIAFPYANHIQQDLQIIHNNPDIGKIITDTRKYQTRDKIYTSTIIKFKHSLKIFFPSDTHMVAAAAYYKNKYGINIHIVCEQKANKTYDLMQQLTDGEQLGIIARPCISRTHVTPLIISRKGEDIFIIALDSVYEESDFIPSIEIIFKNNLITPDDKKNYHLIITSGRRQADFHSCRNDALIILKDALKRPDVVSCFQAFTKRVDSDVYQASANNRVILSTYDTKLPAFLFKTMQINKELTNFTDQDKDTVLKRSADGHIKTLQTHLDKYKRTVIATKKTEIIYEDSDTTSITEHKWPVNAYLQIKGFLILVKAFPELADDAGKIDIDKQKRLLGEYFYTDFRF